MTAAITAPQPTRRPARPVRLRPATFGGFLVACGLGLLGSGAVASTDRVPQMLEEAVREYSEALDAREPDLRSERFRRAQRLFRQVIEEQRVENADLYVNLGNAALQAEQIGSAIHAYRRALSIDPGHGRGRRNLGHARQLLPDWVPRPGSQTLLDTFFFWHQMLSRSARALAASLCFAAAAVLWAVAIRWKRPWARSASLLPAIVWLGLAGYLLAGGTAEEAVVTAPQVWARAADSAGAPARFAEPLPGGTEVKILERRGDWVRIGLADGRDAWVRASGLSAVTAPRSF